MPTSQSSPHVAAPQSERRRSERVMVNDEFAGVPKTPHVRDLSTRGVFVQTLERLPLGREVLLRFTVILEDPVLLEARGRVVRHQRQPSGMAIEFTDLSPETILRLSDAVTMARPLLLEAPATGDAPEPARHVSPDPEQSAEPTVLFEVRPTEDGEDDSDDLEATTAVKSHSPEVIAALRSEAGYSEEDGQ